MEELIDIEARIMLSYSRKLTERFHVLLTGSQNLIYCLPDKDLPAVGAVHNTLRHVDALSSDILSIVDIQDKIVDVFVNAHANDEFPLPIFFFGVVPVDALENLPSKKNAYVKRFS